MKFRNAKEIDSLRKAIKKAKPRNRQEIISVTRRLIAEKCKEDNDYLTYLRTQKYVTSKSLDSALGITAVGIALLAAFDEFISIYIILLLVVMWSLIILKAELEKRDVYGYIFVITEEMLSQNEMHKSVEERNMNENVQKKSQSTRRKRRFHK